jgi:hypothetical protein
MRVLIKKLKIRNEILVVLEYTEKVVISKYFETIEHLKTVRDKENANTFKKSNQVSKRLISEFM